jgi:histidyl-tRNA synthetase
MAMRKLQLYVTEERYRRLKQRAGEQRSLAQVGRDLIDEAGRPDDLESD